MSITKKVEFLLWEKWSQEVKWNTVTNEFRSTSIDVLDTYEREVLVTDLWWFDFTSYSVTSLESMLLDLVLRYVDIIWLVKIIIVR